MIYIITGNMKYVYTYYKPTCTPESEVNIISSQMRDIFSMDLECHYAIIFSVMRLSDLPTYLLKDLLIFLFEGVNIPCCGTD